MADPIFDKNDTAVLDDALPPELEGKSPKEIAAYFRRREQTIIENARRIQPPREEKKPEVIDDKIDLFNDPAGSVNRVVSRQVDAAATRVQNVIQPAMVTSCKVALKDNHPKDYHRFIGEVEKRMMSMSSDAQMNPQFWELTYTTVKGEVTDKLVEEARNEERQKRDNPVEGVTPPGEKPPEPRKLSDEEKTIARKFGLEPKEYQTAAERYETSDGVLPFTYDSRKPKASKRKAG